MRFRFYLMTAIALSFFAGLAVAGPPLICHTYEIGSAKSLPWKGPGFRDLDQAYDLERLPGDTLAILDEKTPLIVRMETIRRAVVYSQWGLVDSKVVSRPKDDRYVRQLLDKIMDKARRTRETGRGTTAAALADFDAGYLIESLKDAGYRNDPRASLDGLAMVQGLRSALPPADLEFAIAKILSHYPGKRPEVTAAIRIAALRAKDGSLLEKNLLSHFPENGTSLAAMRR